MKIKYKILLSLGGLILIVFSLGTTYSIFHSDTNMESSDSKIAKFIFNTVSTDQIQLPLVDLNPGMVKDFSFTVTNSEDTNISDVIIDYKIIVKTYHIVPLKIELYKVGDTEELILNCDESFTRNSLNELVCTTSNQELDYKKLELNNYKLRVTFPSEYSSTDYSNLVDYINIEINSWQKTGD